MSPHLDARQLALLHKALLKKGAELNEKLVRLISGNDVDPGLGVFPAPGDSPADRLRRFMALIDSKIQASRPRATAIYGLCESCATPLSFIELEQLPWAERCRTCSDPLKNDSFGS